MTITISDEEIWYWYEWMEKFLAQEQHGQKAFCELHGLDYNTFCNRYYRIVYISRTKKKAYNKFVPIARKYMDSGMLPSKFIINHDISIRDLSMTCTHLGYLDRIEKLKAKNGTISYERMTPKMNFIPVISAPIPISNGGGPSPTEPIVFEESPKLEPYTPNREPEVMEEQNDLEIMIKKGVKVSIAPNIDATKIIKIIEFLKDL